MRNAEETALTNTSKKLVMRHLKSFQDNDIDSIIADYCDQSILITQKKTYRGVAEIRGFFTGFIVDFPQKRINMELDSLVIQGELAFIIWHAKTPSINMILGTDTFIIKDEKIQQQTFVDMIKFVN